MGKMTFVALVTSRCTRESQHDEHSDQTARNSDAVHFVEEDVVAGSNAVEESVGDGKGGGADKGATERTDNLPHF